MWKVIFGICLTLFPGFWGFSHSIVFTRRILAQPTNATNALEVAKQVAAANIRDDKPVVEALRVCAACQQPQVALEIFQLFLDREQCRTMAISVLGACEKLDVALKLLEDATNIGPYNAAIAAARKAKDWEKALEIYNMTVERGITSGITVNALLTILAQRRQGKVALEILSTMPCKADRLSYQYTVNALVRSGMNDQALELLERVYRDECDIQPTEAMWEVVTDAFSRIEDWENVEKIEQMRYPNLDPSELPSVHGKIFQHFTGLVKVGRGKNVYFEIATIDMPSSERMVVGVHPNRNPSKNGIQIEFYEEKKDGPMQRSKLGYVLVQSAGDKSCLLGMFLNGNLRGQGLSKICLAFWFKLCLSAQAKSTTGIINKPLLALLLEEKFHMSPTGGVEMELCPDPDVSGRVLLYAPTRKDLRGVFSPWDLKQQNLKLLQRPLRERGRMITVGGVFTQNQRTKWNYGKRSTRSCHQKRYSASYNPYLTIKMSYLVENYERVGIQECQPLIFELVDVSLLSRQDPYQIRNPTSFSRQVGRNARAFSCWLNHLEPPGGSMLSWPDFGAESTIFLNGFLRGSLAGPAFLREHETTS